MPRRGCQSGPGRLRGDDFLQRVAVLVAQLADVAAGERLGEPDGGVDLLVGDRDVGDGDLVGGPDLVGPPEGMKHDHVVLDPQEAEPLPVAHRELGHPHLRGPFQGLAQQLIRFRGHRLGRGQVVGGADLDGVDARGRHETHNVDRLGCGQGRLSRSSSVTGMRVPVAVSQPRAISSCRRTWPSSSHTLR